MAQTWNDLLFAHWPVPRERLRQLVPAGLDLDVYDGQGWVAITPFRMSGVRLRGLPPFPGLSTFPELNVRTYVTLDGKPGVFFFSLDATNPVAIAVARLWFHLPYVRARMATRWDGTVIHYDSRRLQRDTPPVVFRGRYHPTGDVFHAQPGSLEHWLTERYCLYAVDTQAHVYRGEIHHVPWPLQPAAADIDANTMTLPLALTLPATPPLLHFARRLDVVAWAPHRR
jgi:uncharacterized protein YqjF (DUF2071 family)